MDTYRDRIELLGFEGKDRITGIVGVIDSLSFDLYGCVQVSVRQRSVKDDGEMPKGYWFDVTRVEVLGDDRIMELPNFAAGYVAQGRKGPADKPEGE